MWFKMKKVGLEFLDEANRIYVVEKETTLSIEIVWDAFAAPDSAFADHGRGFPELEGRITGKLPLNCQRSK